jgi:hypothetical protein
LSFDGFLAVAMERADSMMSLDPVEEQLDLPSGFVALAKRRERQVVGEQHQEFLADAVAINDPPLEFRQPDNKVWQGVGSLQKVPSMGPGECRVRQIKKGVMILPHQAESLRCRASCSGRAELGDNGEAAVPVDLLRILGERGLSDVSFPFED